MENENPRSQYTLGPFIVLTFIYFIVGFLTTVNGQFQAPLQTAFLSHADKLRNTLTTLISFFFFLGYLLNSGLAGKWINRVGYKATLLRSLMIMVCGLCAYILSAWLGSIRPDFCLQIGGDRVPWAYFIFLLGCFVMGTSAAMLQVAINPYVAAYALPGTSTVQRMNIACGINSIGTTIGPFFVAGVIFSGVAIAYVNPGQLCMPIAWIALAVLIVAMLLKLLRLPDLASTRAEADLPRSVWSFSHLALGVLAIFFYVGAEVSIGVNITMHAQQIIVRGGELTFFGNTFISLLGMSMGIPALLATLYWGGMMVGRLAASAFPAASPRVMLAAAAIIASILAIAAMLLDNLYALAAVGLFHSIMWGCVFSLAVAGLGGYTSLGSGAFMMGVFGGAVFPLIQGMLADYLGSWRWTWFLVLGCELALLAYAAWGCKVRDPEARANLMAAPADPGM